MSEATYQELGPLEAGGRSRAVLGLEHFPGRAPCTVVLIFAPPDVVADEDSRARLERETARASQLEHPHILRVHGLTTLERGVARVTEYADAEGLRAVLERAGRLPPLLAARLVADVAVGLHYAHLAGNDDGSPLVHGDVRPDTVLVSHSGMAKVSGYGALSVAPREAGGRRVVNRRAYCAPEQLLGGRAAMQPTTDVFLLGLMLHECLTGLRPFANAEDPEEGILSGTLSPLPADIPSAFGEVVARCTAKRAKERLPTALEVRDALAAAAGGELPSHAELAAWMGQLFPADEPARAERSRLLAAALAHAELVQDTASTRVTASMRPIRVRSSPPAPTASLAPATAAPSQPNSSSPTTPTKPAATPALREGAVIERTASLRNSDEEDEDELSQPFAKYRNPPSRKWVFPATLVVGLIAAAYGVARIGLPNSALPPSIEAAVAARTAKPAPEPVDVALGGAPAQAPAQAPVQTPEAAAAPAAGGTDPEGAAAVADTGAADVPADAPTQAPEAAQPAVASASEGSVNGAAATVPAVAQGSGTVAPAVATSGTLELESPHDLEVRSGGVVLGRTPLKVSLPAGRHVLSLSNRANGISTSRAVVVPAGGVVRQQVSLARGSVSVAAPEGARVTIDGKLVGSAPLNGYPVFEGVHRIMVSVETARWEQSFRMKAGEKVHFDVRTELAE